MSISNSIKKERKTILVHGATGMLGNVVFRYLSSKESYKVYGSVRSAASKLLFKKNLRKNLISDINVNSDKKIANLCAPHRLSVIEFNLRCQIKA